MDATPLISVITVVRNDLPGLAATSECLVRQQCRDFDWTVIDGASTDGCVAFLESFRSMPVQWRSERDRGIYDAMNKGTRLARGRFVIYLNAGDAFSGPHTLTAIAHALRADPEPDVLCCGAFYVCGDRRFLRPPRKIETSIWHTLPSVHQAMLFRRAFLEDPPYDLRYPVSADYHLGAKCFKKGARVAYLDLPVVDFALGGSSAHHRWGALNEALLIQRRVLNQTWPVCVLSALRRLGSQLAVALAVRSAQHSARPASPA